MTDQLSPYIAHEPGDLITADDWNQVQELIRGDISTQIATAVSGITKVPAADDATTVTGKSVDDLLKLVLDYVLGQLPKHTGYLDVFRMLEVGKESVIDHNLATFPLVDLYLLDYFDVVASEDGHIFETLATFFIHHSSESRIRYRPEDQPTAALTAVEIDPAGQHPYHIPFAKMLELFGVEFHDDSTLDDIVTEFWQAFNSPPNSRFDENQYFHSPWFDRCCGERRSVKSMARDWDDIYFEMRPRKSINLTDVENEILAAPNEVEVVQYDLNSVGLILRTTPRVPTSWPQDPPHLKVLALLKV